MHQLKEAAGDASPIDDEMRYDCANVAITPHLVQIGKTVSIVPQTLHKTYLYEEHSKSIMITIPACCPDPVGGVKSSEEPLSSTSEKDSSTSSGVLEVGIACEVMRSIYEQRE